MSIPIDDGNQHRKHELLEGNSLEIGLGILARMIARRLLSCEPSNTFDQVEKDPEPGNVVKVARRSRGKRKKNVRNST
jgi:hypothetical protein